MKPQEIINRWAKATDPRIRVLRLNQDHTIDSRYPDVVPTVHISLELDAGENGQKPLLRAWIPLGRRTPLFAFAKNSARPEQTDIDATFPSFEDADSLVGALDKVHGDFLKRYGRQTKTQKGRL